jgi:hypothetical protein
MTPSALQFGILTNRELVAHGVPEDEVTLERERHTGHVRRLQPRWAGTIGMWGGIEPLAEIAHRAKVDFETAHAYAKFRRLKWLTKKRVFTQSQLGALCLATPGSACEVAPKLGLLPLEVCLYRAAISVLMIEEQVTLKQILERHPAELNRAWDQLGLRVEAPSQRNVLLDLDALDALVKQVERRLATEQR